MNSQKSSEGNKFWQLIRILIGPVLFFVLLVFPPFPQLDLPAQKTIAVVAWMLFWWISEAVEIPVTALLPLVLFPILGVQVIGKVSQAYANPIIFLFMGGFMMALALEKWKLHLRIALSIIRLTGNNANGIILGFMLATATLSMWISNTATAVMMLPIASSVISLLGQSKDISQKGLRAFSLCLMLGIAYSANIGGVATLIGTPPNVVLASILQDSYGYEISFARWMSFGLPFSAVFLLITFLILTRILYPNCLGKFEGSETLIAQELDKLGKVSRGEAITLMLFLTTAFLWITRSYINTALPYLKLSDAQIAMMASISLFVIPVNARQGIYLLRWQDTEKLPWGILLLFGGGISLAGALHQVGLIDLIAGGVANSQHWSFFFISSALIFIALFLTEVMSNVALVTVIIPVIAGLAIALGQNPLWICIPVTMASSCAFMLPMSTPPNAIVFASGHIKVAQMVKAGIILNLIAIISLILLTQWALPGVFGIEYGQVPAWANP
ncbi:MAG: DASS family sodium-coupled anion symporter [Bacteroidota bacterium]